MQPTTNKIPITNYRSPITKLLAPNGAPSLLSPEQYKLVRSVPFLKWFGNFLKAYETKDYTGVSKVVDENGEPLVVWNGSSVADEFFVYDIKHISKQSGNKSMGFNFTTNKRVAEMYADLYRTKGIIRPFFLNIKNIAIYDAEGKNWTKAEWWIGYKYAKIFQMNEIHYNGWEHNDDRDRSGNTALYFPKTDGVWFKNLNEVADYDNTSYYLGDTIVAFKGRADFKLADGRNKTFDGNDPDIRFSDGGKITEEELLQLQREQQNTKWDVERYREVERQMHELRGKGLTLADKEYQALVKERSMLERAKLKFEEGGRLRDAEGKIQYKGKVELFDFPKNMKIMQISDTLKRYCSNELHDMIMIQLQFATTSIEEAERWGTDIAKRVILLSHGLDSKNNKLNMRSWEKIMSKKAWTEEEKQHQQETIKKAKGEFEDASLNDSFGQGGNIPISEAIKQIKEDAASIGKRIDFGFNYATLYHGTSEKAAKEIRNTGFFRDGFFFSSKGKQQYGDSVEQYARIRAEQKGETGKGAVIEMRVSPDSFHINIGSSEIESDGDLYLWSDNVWRNKPETKTELDTKSVEEVNEILQIPAGIGFARMLLNRLRQLFYTDGIRDFDSLQENFMHDIDFYLDMYQESPRKFANKAKLFKMDKDTFNRIMDKIKADGIEIFLKNKFAAGGKISKIKFSDFNDDIQTFIFELLESKKYISSHKDETDLDNFIFTVNDYEINKIKHPKIIKENLDKERGAEYATERFTDADVQPVIFMNDALVDGMHRTYAKKIKGDKYIKGIELSEFIKRNKLSSGGYIDSDYSKWKRKNVTYRGIRNSTELPNEVYGSIGNGLYTTPASNKAMAKQYGAVYYVVNARPKNPKVFNTLNEWEIWFWNKLVFPYSQAKGKEYPDKRDFNENTTIEAEVQKLGYDGVEIKGREMVNYTPQNVKYFRNEDELKSYYELIKNNFSKGGAIKSLIKNLSNSYLENYPQGSKACDINTGDCPNFAEDLYYEIINSGLGNDSDTEMLSTDSFYEIATDISKSDSEGADDDIWLKLEDYNSPYPKGLKLKDNFYHVWVYHKGKHYDAEVPDGVINFFDLPTFKSEIKKANGGSLFTVENSQLQTLNSKLLAPNGKLSNLSVENYKLVRSVPFLKFFGNWLKAYETKDYTGVSKVLDENFEPLVCWHGTRSHTKDFSEFKPNSHFGTEAQAKDRGSKLYQVFLNIRNPFDSVDRYQNWSPAIKEAREKGFDGIKYLNIFEGEIIGGICDYSYVVFKSNQIKLANGVNKTFDAKNPDIRFGAGGSLTTELLAPNGKKSNLSAVQHKIVRTPEFRNWFGQWDKKDNIINFLLSENVKFDKKLNRVPIPFHLKKDNDAIEKYFRENININNKNNSEININTGLQINITRKCFNKVIWHNAEKIYHIVLSYIHEIIKNCIFITSLPNDDINSSNDRARVRAIESPYYLYFFLGVNIFGENYTLYIVVEKTKSYGLQIYDVTLLRKEKSDLVGELLLSMQGADTKSDLHGKDKKLKYILQEKSEEISKVLDINGEPLLVYHGYMCDTYSPKTRFYEFKSLPAFFSASQSFAEDYASTKSFDQAADADICSHACFLNIKKLFDPNDSECIELARQQLPDKINVSHGTFWMFSADIPKEAVVEEMAGIETIPPDPNTEEIKIKNIGDTLEEKVAMSQYETQILLYKDDDWAYTCRKSSFDEYVEFEVADFILTDNPPRKIKYHGKYFDELILNRETWRYEYNKDPEFQQFHDEVAQRKKYYIDNAMSLMRKTDSDDYSIIVITNTKRGGDKYLYVKKRNLKQIKVKATDNWTLFENDTVQKFLTDNGFGGWIAFEKKDKTYAVYNAENIKLADGTNAKFNLKNKDVRFGAGGTLRKNQLKLMRGEGNSGAARIDLFGKGLYLTDNLDVARYYGEKVSFYIVTGKILDVEKELTSAELIKITEAIDEVLDTDLGNKYLNEVISYNDGKLPRKTEVDYMAILRAYDSWEEYYNLLQQHNLNVNELSQSNICTSLNIALKKMGYVGLRYSTNEIEDLEEIGLGDKNTYVIFDDKAIKKSDNEFSEGGELITDNRLLITDNFSDGGSVENFNRRADNIVSDNPNKEGSLAHYSYKAQLDWLGKGTRFYTPIKQGTEKIKVYRSLPKEFSEQGVTDGNYVSNSKQYSVDHAKYNLLNTDNIVVEKEVYLDELYPADAPNEFWYVSREYFKNKFSEGVSVERKVPRDFDTDLGVRFGQRFRKTGDIIVAHSTSSNKLPQIYREGLKAGKKSVWDDTTTGNLYFEIEPTRTYYGDNVYGWKATQKFGGAIVTLYVKVKESQLEVDRDDAVLGVSYQKNQRQCACDIPPENIIGLNFVGMVDVKRADFIEFSKLFKDDKKAMGGMILERGQFGEVEDYWDFNSGMGQAGDGVYFYIPDFEMRKYYSNQNENIYRVKLKEEANIIDLTKEKEQLIKFINKDKKGANSLNYQTFAWDIMAYMYQIHPNAHGYIIQHKGIGIPTGKQVILTKPEIIKEIIKIKSAGGRIYWGHKAGGCIFYCHATKRVLVAHRSDDVYEPNTWGTWGGKTDGDEQVIDAVRREIEEETEYRGEYELNLVYNYKDGGFEYHNYLAIVPEEFEPQLNWESQGFGWFKINELPKNLHFGFKKALPYFIDAANNYAMGGKITDYRLPTTDNRSLITDFDWSQRVGSDTKVLDNPYEEGVPSKEKVNKIKKWLSNNSDRYDIRYVKFYHGTGKGLPIEKEGLLPTSGTRRRSFQSTSGYVYLANTPERAKTFGDLGNMSNTNVYEVIVRVIDLLADVDQLNNMRSVGEQVGNSVAESIVYGGGVRVKWKIDTWQIRKMDENEYEFAEGGKIPSELSGKREIGNIGFGGVREHTTGKVRLEDLKVLDNAIENAKNTFKNDKSFKPSKKPVTVGVDINTGEKQLLDGYHRYVDKGGVGEWRAYFIPMRNGDIISFDEIFADGGKLPTPDSKLMFKIEKLKKSLPLFSGKEAKELKNYIESLEMLQQEENNKKSAVCSQQQIQSGNVVIDSSKPYTYLKSENERIVAPDAKKFKHPLIENFDLFINRNPETKEYYIVDGVTGGSFTQGHKKEKDAVANFISNEEYRRFMNDNLKLAQLINENIKKGIVSERYVSGEYDETNPLSVKERIAIAEKLIVQQEKFAEQAKEEDRISHRGIFGWHPTETWEERVLKSMREKLAELKSQTGKIAEARKQMMGGKVFAEGGTITKAERDALQVKIDKLKTFMVDALPDEREELLEYIESLTMLKDSYREANESSKIPELSSDFAQNINYLLGQNWFHYHVGDKLSKYLKVNYLYKGKVQSRDNGNTLVITIDPRKQPNVGERYIKIILKHNPTNDTVDVSLIRYESEKSKKEEEFITMKGLLTDQMTELEGLVEYELQELFPEIEN